MDIFLDTNIILKLVIKTDVTPDIQQSMYNIKKNYTEIIIPQVVVGETLVKLIEISKPHEKYANICNFVDFLEKKVGIYNNIPVLYDKVMNTAIDIKNNVYNIDYCDAVVIAHAMSFGKTCALFTTDKKIYHSEYLNEQRRKLKDKGIEVHITDSS